ncbi:MAG: glycosyltransferase family 4 protein [Chloroflexi bacterium]|nr:glycosyltransferase family 4 protein [Chloroflexota bacterium]MCL5110644.1 glycosyltransferase family 4 protein [Chloroflexota bacterium]
MLIGIDISRAVRSQRTGTENYSLHLIDAMMRTDDPAQFVLYCDAQPAPGTLPNRDNARVRTLPAGRLWTHRHLAWEVARHPPHVLFVPAHVLPLACRPPAVVTVHDLGYLHYPDAHPPLARLYLSLGTRLSVRAARRVIAVSQFTKAELMRALGVPADKIVVVPEAPTPGFAPLGERSAGLAVAARYGLREPYLLAIGTIHARKNLVRLLEAFALARREYGLRHQLGLAGGRGYRAQDVATTIRQLGLSEAVVETGYVPAGELPALLGAADGLAFPSLHEGFGLPALEAMACGVPVLAARASSLPEVVADCGLLVDPLSVPELAAGLARLVQDRALHDDLATRGLSRARQFTWERAARETLAVLHAAVS